MPESFKRFNTVFSSGWIDIGTSWGMNEVMSRAQKFQIERSLMTSDGFGSGFILQTLLKDSFDTINVQQFETQSALAGGVEPHGAIALGQAEQLLGRTEPAPGELTG